MEIGKEITCRNCIERTEMWLNAIMKIKPCFNIIYCIMGKF